MGRASLILLFATLLVSPVSSQEPPRSPVQRFLITPKDRIVSAGASLTLECVIANIGGQCSWERDGIPVGLYPDKYHLADSEAGDCSLTILEASPEWDEGEWRCQVSAGDIARADSLISPPARLTVTQPPSEVSLVTTEDRGPRCVTSASNPPAEIKVLLDNEVISIEEAQENVRLDNGGWRSSLDLASVMVRPNNRRTLRCVAQHGVTNTSLVTSTVLNVTFPPTVISARLETAADRKQNYYLPGDPAVLQCEVESNPAASIRWRHVVTGRMTAASGTGQAVIKVEGDTGGEYECVAENELGVSVSAPVGLSLAHAPRVASGGRQQSDLRVSFGENLTFLCEAFAIPKPDYRWLLKDPSGDISIVASSALLTIDSAGYQHTGEFLCEASNVMGTSLGDVHKVSVEGRPVIQNPPTVKSNFTITSGDKFSFAIEVCSRPEPNVSWHKDSQEIHSHSLERIREGCILSTLTLRDIGLADAGQYRMVVSNSLGDDSVTMQLHVTAAGLTKDLIIGAGAGATMILFVILAPAIIFVIHRRSRNNVITTQSSGSNTNKCSDIENPSQHGSKEELIVDKGLAKSALTSEAADPVIVRNLYTQLGFPKSSNCGSMRRKKENHYNDMIQVYNATISRNLNLNPGSLESSTTKPNICL